MRQKVKTCQIWYHTQHEINFHFDGIVDFTHIFGYLTLVIVAVFVGRQLTTQEVGNVFSFPTRKKKLS